MEREEETDKQTDRQTDMQADRQTDRDRQADRQTDRQNLSSHNYILKYLAYRKPGLPTLLMYITLSRL